MALVIKINGVDKTSLIKWSDFSVEHNITKDPDLCSFSLYYKLGGYKPSPNDALTVDLGATRIFAGTIIDVTDRLTNGKLESVDCNAKDYTFDLDRKLVTTAYSNKAADFIIKDIIDQFCPNFTYANVAVGAGTVKKITFNYDYPSKAIQKIADLFNWDWYVDYNKDLHFFNSETLTAPYELNEDTNDTFIGESLQIKQDLSQIKNSIFVRGGDQTYALTNTNAEQYVADGKQNTFVIGHKFDADTSFAVEKSTDGGSTWSGLTEGAYGTDNPASFDILYDPNKRAVIFREDNKPANGNLIRVFGNYTLPVIVYRSDQTSIGKYGEFQFRIVDNSISSKDEAAQKALAELKKYGDIAHSGGFKSYKDGWDVGQWVTINLPTVGVTGKFKIQKVQITVVEPATPKLQYDCTVVASEIVDSVDILGNLLIGSVNQNITIEQNEVVDKVYGFIETMVLTEDFEATVHPKASPDFAELCALVENWRTNPWGVDTNPIWVAGDDNGNYFPTGTSDRNRVPQIDAGLTVQ